MTQLYDLYDPLTGVQNMSMTSMTQVRDLCDPEHDLYDLVHDLYDPGPELMSSQCVIEIM